MKCMRTAHRAKLACRSGVRLNEGLGLAALKALAMRHHSTVTLADAPRWLPLRAECTAR